MLGTPTRVARLRAIAWLAGVLVAAAALLYALIGPSGSYVLDAHFSDAGQLVKGDIVTVGGHRVGSVTGLSLTANGLADVQITISDSALTPIGSDSSAQIGEISLSGETNRFVDLLVAGGRPLPSGSTLPVAQTQGIVDLDSVLDALTPKVLASLTHVFSAGAHIVAGQTPAEVHRLVDYLNPALAQTTVVLGQLRANRYALSGLISDSSTIAAGLAAHTGQLTSAIANTAGSLQAVSANHAALAAAIAGTPGLLTNVETTLSDTRSTLHVVNPVLVALRPSLGPLAGLLRTAVPAARNATPAIRELSALIPAARQALTSLPPAAKAALPAIHSLTSALGPITPILSGFRVYAPEVIAGFVEGLGGSESVYRDANGEYARVQPVIAPTSQAGLDGVLSSLGSVLGETLSASSLNGLKVGQFAPCPGGGESPATAGGNPWTSPDVSVSDICDPADDQ